MSRLVGFYYKGDRPNRIPLPCKVLNCITIHFALYCFITFITFLALACRYSSTLHHNIHYTTNYIRMPLWIRFPWGILPHSMVPKKMGYSHEVWNDELCSFVGTYFFEFLRAIGVAPFQINRDSELNLCSKQSRISSASFRTLSL